MIVIYTPSQLHCLEPNIIYVSRGVIGVAVSGTRRGCLMHLTRDWKGKITKHKFSSGTATRMVLCDWAFQIKPNGTARRAPSAPPERLQPPNAHSVRIAAPSSTAHHRHAPLHLRGPAGGYPSSIPSANPTNRPALPYPSLFHSRARPPRATGAHRCHRYASHTCGVALVGMSCPSLTNSVILERVVEQPPRDPLRHQPAHSRQHVSPGDGTCMAASGGCLVARPCRPASPCPHARRAHMHDGSRK